jgi:diacylglycerol kinase (ATP)
MATFQHIHVIINPASGRNEPILNTLNTVWQPHDLNWQVSITHKLGDGARYARQAIESGAELIVAYGGDGTVRDVASGMIDQSVPLALLPGGTGNALVDELGIPAQLEAAARLVVAEEAQYRAVDVGRVGEGYFLLRVGTGLMADYSSQISREMKNNWGVLAYYVGAFRVLRNLETYTYTMQLDGQTVEADGVACLVMNTSAAGGSSGFRLSSQVQIDDGLLDVYVLTGRLQAILDVARTVADVQPGQQTEALKHWQAKHITIDGPNNMQIYADGENMPTASTPVEMQVMPGVLRVLVPNPDNHT